MSDVKRYMLEIGLARCQCRLTERDDGTLIKFTDFDALRRERDGLRKLLEEAQPVVGWCDRANYNSQLVARDEGNDRAEEFYRERGREITAVARKIEEALKASDGGEVTDG